jgi:hypothetical protein
MWAGPSGASSPHTRWLSGVGCPDVDPLATLPVNCVKCGQALTLAFSEWQVEAEVEPPLSVQVWICPYCKATNTGRMPGRLTYVFKGHR